MRVKENYFNILFEKLEKFGLLPNQKEIACWRWDFQKYYEDLKIEPHILADIRAKYGVGFENVVLVNCKKYTLLSKFFCKNTNILLIQTAVYFVLLGCVIDYLLDNGNNEQRQVATEKLCWEYCKDYFEDFKDAKSDSILDQLYALLARGFAEIYTCHLEKYNYLIKKIKNAIEAELYVINTKIMTFVRDSVMNKSTLFVLIATEIALAESQNITEDKTKIFFLMGELFALIDDVCDSFEDIEKGQKNVVWNELERNNDMEVVLEKVVHNIYNNLELIKKYTNAEIYHFFLAETQEWVLSCSELRERVWNLEEESNILK